MDADSYRYTKKNSFSIKDVAAKEKEVAIKDGSEDKSLPDYSQEFRDNLKEISSLQQKLYAERKEGLIIVFQAMDAAGKDGVIRTVFRSLTPHGVKEYCFKVPSQEELSHDFLWRFWQALPARGNISIFNRSYYENVLVEKVHELYKNYSCADRLEGTDVISKRYREINAFERYLYNNSIRVVKIFLNVSKDEQARRFISRIDTPKKNWKVSENDIREREYWDEYQKAFEDAINATASPIAPWYVVPADDKPYARLLVSRIVLKTLKNMNPSYPSVKEEDIKSVSKYRKKLEKSIGQHP